MTPIPPPAEELRLLDAELRQLDARRAVLLHRRAWLVHMLQPRPAPTGPPPPPVRRPEATAPGVQNVLLILGGVLLTVAAVAFTLVSWGHLGIVGRSTVLGAVTLAALGSPVPLLRRGLRSTAESLAGLGLVLTVLDAYALHTVALPDTDGVGFAALASATLAAGWAAYGLTVGARRGAPGRQSVGVSTEGLTPAGLGQEPAASGAGPEGSGAEGSGPEGSGAEGSGADTGRQESGAGRASGEAASGGRAARPASGEAASGGRAAHPASGAVRRGAVLGLRLPVPAAVVAAQFPLILWAAAVGAGAHAITAALLVTAAFDAVIALRAPSTVVRVVAAAGAFGLGGWGTFAGCYLSWTADGPSGAARAAALLLLAASIALSTAWAAARPAVATGTATAAGLITVVAFGGVLRTVLPGEWTVPAHLVCGLALLAAVRPGLPEPVRRGIAAASGSVQALAVLWALPVVVVSLVGPLAQAGGVWSGAPATARDAVTSGLPWPRDALTAPLVLGLVAAVLVVTVRSAAWRPRALTGALVLAWSTALSLPAALELPYAAGLSVHGLTTVALLALARRTRPPVISVVLALVTSVDLAFLALASETATLSVFAALAVLFAVTARQPGLGPVGAPAALGHLAASACAVGASLGWQPQHTALLVLAVPVVAALLAARLADVPTTVSVEITGAVTALLAVTLAVTDPPMLATVLALCGVIAAGTAVREDRRSVGYAAAALFVLATWVRLAAWDVTSPEAYTLPVTVPALLVGVFRRREDPAVSSWTAYAPGLSVSLFPSLLATWADPQALRPLLLGAAALAVTLLGARHRLQAPLLLGGTALTLDALHELAPYIVQMVDALPRWVAPALAGVLLLALGATYEQRIRDARRVRDVLGRMD
ncbi:SCO7613 C-terminal domain-containing membrane protein [Streptomyces sp. NPDC102279]|uniref:SCO7613 C-terminal domain-containing membrane protein n=1 Tax=Streptomyces sp. NPDC102279 TaxID=3366153 RepID=UPI0037F6640F